ncbi:MAG: transglycosylase domain-containing protein [Acidimicrobiaceae bacterium]|nr:transglycosylase domain-containing protein [Acidimicrobiaceae bacterium]
MPARRRWARRLLWLVLALAIAAGTGSRLLDSLPSPPQHASVAPSVLYDRYGTPIAEIGPSVPHASLGLEDMAPALVDALVAVLDPSFLERDGVDAGAYAVALRQLWGEPDPARNGIMRRYLETVHDPHDGAASEARLLLAELRLGRQLSRPEILERYANIVYLGRGAYGVHAAANAWYGIPASDLTVTQAAYIASLVDAPWGVDAASGPADDRYRSTRQDRDRVLVTMYQHGMLTSDELATGRSQPVPAGVRPAAALGVGAAGSGTPDPGTPDHGTLDAAAGGFVRMLIAEAGLTAAVGQAYVELVERYGIHRVVTGGLHVTTSVDVPAQRAAVRAVRTQLDSAASSAVGAEVAVLDRSGDVRVLVSAGRASTAGDVDVEAGLRPRPFGDLLGPAADVVWAWIVDGGDETSVGTVPLAGDASQVAAAFSVIATGGERRTSRIVLEASDTPPSRSLPDRDTDRWPMERTLVPAATSITELRAGMDSLTLPSGVPALGRAGVSTGTGDAWFAGWTTHYIAAVRIASKPPTAEIDLATATGELFAAVLDPLQHPP